MVTADPRIHVICGVCGSKDFFIASLRFDPDQLDYSVFIACENCTTITKLSELMEVKRP